MLDRSQHILLLEPYYGGSHKAFLTGLQGQLDCCYTLVSLPARKWKMRMQLAAPWFFEQICRLVEQGTHFDGILTSTFLDVAVLRTLLARQGVDLPLVMYFHENQFSYPGQVHDPGMFQFTSINFNSALCADRLAFNSRYNLETFLNGIHGYLKKATDMDLRHLEEQIQEKSIILYPGIDFQQIDTFVATRAESSEGKQDKQNAPVIVWNHRWEHDKDPETFFHVLFELVEAYPFQLIVLGQHFRNQPEIFIQAKKRLKQRLLHFGYAENREEYACLLSQGDYIVSTALHEFFGISVLEGVRAGCCPVVPDRLSYKELFPQQYRYAEGKLAEHLKGLLARPLSFTATEARQLTEKYNWSVIGMKYRKWLDFNCINRMNRQYG
ncbi:tRNA-queuosine alpha-mannosyltransferase domain-containing protein [Candidatus Electrothrix sp.]|uniref:tRNA-queuosine alpha-mannosyltransferase domain-containing protein n=3 Tax=Candidatus Electrothrix sp. TaxID=2170559 RepID=UPI0040579DE3